MPQLKNYYIEDFKNDIGNLYNYAEHWRGQVFTGDHAKDLIELAMNFDELLNELLKIQEKENA